MPEAEKSGDLFAQLLSQEPTAAHLRSTKVAPFLPEERHDTKRVLIQLFNLKEADAEAQLCRVESMTIGDALTEAGAWNLIGQRLNSSMFTYCAGVLFLRIHAAVRLFEILGVKQ